MFQICHPKLCNNVSSLLQISPLEYCRHLLSVLAVTSIQPQTQRRRLLGSDMASCLCPSIAILTSTTLQVA